MTNDHGMVVWITGLSGAGKSTVGHCVWQRLRQQGVPALYLDGDVLREMLGRVDAHTPAERLELAHTYGRICHALAAQGMIVVCSTISMFHAVRRWNRDNNARYVEVYLRVPVDELRRRDPKGLYARQDGNMIGVDIPFEEPAHPDLVIDNLGAVDPEQACQQILAEIAK
jgi:adenylylsulfate kinase-like enzyme